MGIKRVRRMLVSPEFLVMLSRGRYEVLENELPADAKVVSAGMDGPDFFLTVESDEFLLVDDSETPPRHPSPIIKQLDQ